MKAKDIKGMKIPVIPEYATGLIGFFVFDIQPKLSLAPLNSRREELRLGWIRQVYRILCVADTRCQTAVAIWC